MLPKVPKNQTGPPATRRSTRAATLKKGPDPEPEPSGHRLIKGTPTRSEASKRKAKSDVPDPLPSKKPQRTTKQPQVTKAQASARKTKKAVKAVPQPPVRPLNSAPAEAIAVFPVGSGECGELGMGPKRTELNRPRINEFLDPNDPSSKFHIVQLACGGMHTVALTTENEIVTWGVNDNGALGRNTDWDSVLRDVDAESGDEEGELNPFESTPTAIPSKVFPSDTRFVQVAAGDSCSFALTDHGLVFGWGTFRDASGHQQFRYGIDGKIVEKQQDPIQIEGLEKIVQITCGANHVLALDVKGKVWGWGAHEQNQLGRRLFGRHMEHLRPRLVEVCKGQAKYISSGEYHAFAIDLKDNVWAWGLNSFGEAGYAKGAGGDSALLPYPMKVADLCGKSIKVISGGAHHSAAVSEAGDFLVWGRMDGGQMGIAFTAEQLADETLIRHDEREKPRICLRPTKVPYIGDALHVACGTDHTIFVNKDGNAFATGFGSSGQLGLGGDDDVDVAQQIRSKHLKDQDLTWAGAGGQFSILAGPKKR